MEELVTKERTESSGCLQAVTIAEEVGRTWT